MKTCPSCGKGIADNTNYCPFCGAPCKEDRPQGEASEHTSYGGGAGNAPYTAPPAQQGTNGMGIAGLVLGIVALIFSFIPSVSFIGWICGVVGIIISAIAISQMKQAGQTRTGIAVAGLVISIISIAIGLIVFLIACAAGCTFATMFI